MPVSVRRATSADAAKVAEFAVALARLHAEWNGRRFTAVVTSEGAQRFYRERVESANAAVFVVEEGQGIIGFAYMEYEPIIYAELATRVAWLHDIYVEPEARGGGAGNALLGAVREEAKRLGANKVLLSVAVGNVNGRRLFEQNGFCTTMNEMMLVVE